MWLTALAEAKDLDKLHAISDAALKKSDLSTVQIGSAAVLVETRVAMSTSDALKGIRANPPTYPDRSEKCPVLSCEFNLKGFARKYDRDRHALMHYEGPMKCGFCEIPKIFNRADVFKQHLATVHGVEQMAPQGRESRRVSSTMKKLRLRQDGINECSICSKMFESAQIFYEHFDSCVLREVYKQQSQPQQQHPQQQRQQQQKAPQAPQEKLSEHDNEQLTRLAAQMEENTPIDDMDVIRKSLQKISEEQKRAMIERGIDPLAYSFRSQALKQFRKQKQAQEGQSRRTAPNPGSLVNGSNEPSSPEKNVVGGHALVSSLKVAGLDSTAAPPGSRCKLHMAYTISQDWSGNQERCAKTLLVALGTRTRKLELRKFSTLAK